MKLKTEVGNETVTFVLLMLYQLSYDQQTRGCGFDSHRGLAIFSLHGVDALKVTSAKN